MPEAPPARRTSQATVGLPRESSASQAIGVAQSLLADQERILGSDHPDTMKTCSSLAAAYRDAGRADDAIALDEEDATDGN